MSRCRDCQRCELLNDGDEILCTLGITFADMDSLDNHCRAYLEECDHLDGHVLELRLQE